jgi:hypothetical protein
MSKAESWSCAATTSQNDLSYEVMHTCYANNPAAPYVTRHLLVRDQICQFPSRSHYCWDFYPAGASSVIFTTQTTMTLNPMAVHVAQDGYENWRKVYGVVLGVRVVH